MSQAIRELLEADGIAIRCEAECIRFAPRAADIAVGVNCTTGEPEVVGSHVLLATLKAATRRRSTGSIQLSSPAREVFERGI